MIEPLAFATTAVALLGGLWSVFRAAAGRHRWATCRPLLASVELALLVQAVAVTIAWAAGTRPGEPATHLAYLVTSLVVLPAAVSQAGGDDGRWAGVLLGVTLVVVAVLVVRMQTTYRHG